MDNVEKLLISLTVYKKHVTFKEVQIMKFNAETYNSIYHPAPEAANVAAHVVKANKKQEPQEPQQEPQEPEPKTGGDESGGDSEPVTE